MLDPFFILLTAISVALAVVQIKGRWARDLAPARSALVFGGTAYLASWLLQVGVYELAVSPVGRDLPLRWLLLAQSLLSALLGLALWSALVRLSFQDMPRKDLLWVIPFGFLSILVGAAPRISPITAALVAAPALVRARWRRDITSGTSGLASLFGVLFVLLYFISLRLPAGSLTAGRTLGGLERYADWVRGLAAVHIMLALPRLLWRTTLPVRSVKRRLMVSHLLTGLVPLALVTIFWGLSTYLSVTAERAQIAARILTQEAAELGEALEGALAAGGAAQSNLRAWVQMEAGHRPGLSAWVRSADPDSGMVRVAGPAVAGERALAQWPDTMAQQGVVLLAGTPYLGAVRRSVADPHGPVAAAMLAPTSGALGPALRREVAAETHLETRWVVGASPGDLALTPAARDSSDAPGSLSAAGEGRASAGAAALHSLEWTGRHWQERRVLLWARIGFLDAVRGVARNVGDNPYSLVALIFLGVVAVLFVLVEVLTVGMVVSMGRSVLRALSALRQGTARLRSGNLRYRIPIEGDDDLWDVAESFNEMAGDLDRAREAEIDKERLEGELNLARQIQARLLPAEAPILPRLELSGLSLPAREVGGDYYDYLLLPGDRLGLIVADVSGKGVGAALLMSSFRASLLSQDLHAQGPALTLSRLNGFLHRSVEPGRFVTAFLAVIDLASGRLTYANAGHNPPVWIRRSGEHSLLREGGLILGLMKAAEYEQVEVQLSEEDLLVLYTDGVTEATNEDEDFWGEERLYDCLRLRRASSCREILREVMRDVRAFVGGEGQSDDLTLVLARWRGKT